VPRHEGKRHHPTHSDDRHHPTHPDDRHHPTHPDGPRDTPWNTRELTVTDPEGNRFTFTGRGTEPTEDFQTVMARLTGEEG
jgi:hypothetical protein